MFHNSFDIIRVPLNKTKQLEDKEDIKYKCDMCDETGWTSETDTALHAKKDHKQQISSLVKNSSNNNPLCLVCLAKQPDITSLVSHWKTSHLLSSPTAVRVEREIFICDKCGELFFNKQFLRVHIQRLHTLERARIECPKCHRYIKFACISHHLCLHSVLRLSSCPICLHKCSNRSSLHKHISNMHRKHLLCNICRFVTTKEEIFNAHLKKYEQRNEKAAKKLKGNCSINYERYFLRPRVKNVWRNPVSRYSIRGLVLYNDINICVMCRQICHNRSQMENHIKQDHRTYEMLKAPKVNLHKCGCGELFDNAVLLKQHMFKMKHRDYTVDLKQVEENPSDNSSLESSDDSESSYDTESTDSSEY